MGSSILAQGLFIAVLELSCLIPFGILILSWPGIQPVSPALEDRFLTTEPPGKSQVGKELWRKTNTFWVDWWLSQRHNLFINWFNNYFLSTHLILHFGENIEFSLNFSSVQSLSCVRFFVTPWTAACQASLSITNSQSLPKLMSIESVMPFNHLILCRPLLLLPSIPPSIRVFSNESALRIRWPKYWSFSFNISLSNEHSGLISFRMDWLYLLTLIVFFFFSSSNC